MQTPWIHRRYRAGLGLENFCIGLGALLACGALWPIYYGFRIPNHLDLNALSSGIVGWTAGLSLLIWGIRGRQAPRKAIWVDLKKRELTVLGESEPLTVALDEVGEVGEVTVRHRTYTVRRNNRTRNVSAYSVHAAGPLADLMLFDANEPAESKTWAAGLCRRRRLLRLRTHL